MDRTQRFAQRRDPKVAFLNSLKNKWAPRIECLSGISGYLVYDIKIERRSENGLELIAHFSENTRASERAEIKEYEQAQRDDRLERRQAIIDSGEFESLDLNESITTKLGRSAYLDGEFVSARDARDLNLNVDDMVAITFRDAKGRTSTVLIDEAVFEDANFTVGQFHSFADGHSISDNEWAKPMNSGFHGFADGDRISVFGSIAKYTAVVTVEEVTGGLFATRYGYSIATWTEKKPKRIPVFILHADEILDRPAN